MKNITTKLFTSTFIVFFILNLTACGINKEKVPQTANEPKIMFGEQKSSHAAPLVVAEAKGFFKDEGLNVEVKWFPSGGGPQINEGLASKSLDTAHMGTVPALLATSRMPVSIISGTLVGGHGLITRPDVQSIKELRGKRLAMPKRGSLQDFYLRSILLKNGLDPEKDVSISEVPADATIAVIKQGSIDAAMVSDIIAIKAKKENGLKVLVWAGDEFPEYVSEVLVIRDEILNKQPAIAQKILKAYIRAIDFVNKNPQETAKLLAPAIGISEDIAFESVKNIPWTAKIEPITVEEFAQKMVQMGYIENMPDIKKAIKMVK